MTERWWKTGWFALSLLILGGMSTARGELATYSGGSVLDNGGLDAVDGQYLIVGCNQSVEVKFPTALSAQILSPAIRVHMVGDPTGSTIIALANATHSSWVGFNNSGSGDPAWMANFLGAFGYCLHVDHLDIGINAPALGSVVYLSIYNPSSTELKIDAVESGSLSTFTEPFSNHLPAANAGGPYVAFATSWGGADVQLNGSGFDQDGDTLSYAWDLNGDGIPDATDASLSAFFPYGQTSVTLTVLDTKGGIGTATTTVTVGYRGVAIDVKPGDPQNVVNMGSSGVIPVVFLSSGTFDATTINPASVALRGEDFTNGLVRMRGKNGAVPQAAITDVNGDGLNDLLVHIETEKLADYDLQTVIEIGAKTTAGEVILGSDTLTVIHQE